MHAPSGVAPLLATKLHLPLPRATAVARPRLVARVQTGLRGRLTLLAAPPGFGKSTLLALWLHQNEEGKIENRETAHSNSLFSILHSPFKAGWLALDAGDNEPTRFWSYICAALERASPGLGAPALAILRADPSAAQTIVAELINALAAATHDVVLVLDDYHVISVPEIHQGISFLIEHAPPQFHLVLASRVDPPLPLARWRARGELVELRVNDLRFSPEEAEQFFGGTMGLPLDPAAIAALEARTEGWAAGLQLAALSLQGEADVPGFIASFSGSHRHVVDYLAEEVLARQPEHVRAFLLQTAILDRFCGPLCDAVLGVDAASAGDDSYSWLILDRLERDNLFLIPLDGQRRWYRYHHLFGDLLRHRLVQEQPALVATLHRRAAAWFEQHGAAEAAAEHALSAGDSALLARLLVAYGTRFAATGATRTLQRWLDALPREVLLASPQLCLTQVKVLVLHRRKPGEIEPYLQAAEAALVGHEPATASLRGELLTQRVHIAIERGEYAQALSLAQEAEALLPPEDRWARSSNGLVLGYSLMLLGRTDEAVDAYAANVELCRAAGNAVSGIFSANELIKLRLLQGRLRDAKRAAEEALAWVGDAGWQQLPPTSALHIWRGNVLIEQGELQAAANELALAHTLTQAGITTARAYTFLARLALLQGNPKEADAALRTVETICRDWDGGGERVFFEAYVARLRLLGGDADTARRWAAGRLPWSPAEAPGYFREIELLTLARVAILADESELEGTLALLHALREQARAAGRGAVEIEALALEALALFRQGDAAGAQERLDEALALAAPEGFIGLFAELGPAMAKLVAQRATRNALNDPLQPYLRRMLSAFPGAQAGAPPVAAPEQSLASGTAPLLGGETLTEREREVLRLFAAGMTSAEIAQQFVVSVNTVKTQLKSIYSKLDTHSRGELVARARALGLIN